MLQAPAIFIHELIEKNTLFKTMKRQHRHILCITMQVPPPTPPPLDIGIQQNAKLSRPLFSKINANSVTCQVENVLLELSNECFCVCCEPHATQLPAGSNTHYPCGILPPSDTARLSARCFLCCSACVSLSSLCLPCMCKHLCVTCVKGLFFVA